MKKMTTMLVVIAAAAVAAIGLAMAQPQHHPGLIRAINPPGSLAELPFSNGILAGNTLYVAGTQETDANGKLESGIEAQTRAALEQIRKIIEGGMTIGNLVAVNVYLADVNNFAKINGVYKTFFPDPRPTRTTVQVAGLVNGARIEISAIAVKPH